MFGGTRRVPKQITEEHCPLVHVLRRADQLVHECVPLGCAFVIEETGDIGGGGNAPGHVQINAADELFVGAERRGLNVVLRHLVEDDIVNEIFARDALRWHQRQVFIGGLRL
jgi:hypothetical protein